jgi:hypothetical protein
MKQTAVGFLENQYNSNGKLTPVDFYQSKEMEKQHIIDAYEVAYMDGYNDNGKDGKQYYNETFNKDE